jgi:hypothetical protein
MLNRSTPPSTTAASRIGFQALTRYDSAEKGGNGDGWINEKDRVFVSLRLWVDRNHDGIPEPGELLTMREAGITAISVAFSPNKWSDAYGNKFTNRALIVRTQGPGVDQSQWAYDVMLASRK